MNRLKEKYQKEAIAALTKEFGYIVPKSHPPLGANKSTSRSELRPEKSPWRKGSSGT